MNASCPFQPHPLLRGGHLQTLAGFYLPTKIAPYHAKLQLLSVSGGDKIALHDDCPTTWTETDPVVLLIHGLAGCHNSSYVARLMERLVKNGLRCFRMDMRGSGASTGMAKEPGHAGRTDDAAVAIDFIADRCPLAPLTLVGFSMGGNISLGTTAIASKQPVGNLSQCIAISPPVDLSRCCHELRQGVRSLYDRFLLRHLIMTWQQNGGQVPTPTPRSIYEFDDRITAPVCGFRDAEDYYDQSSSGPRLMDIEIPTTILAARDDPMVSVQAIESASRSPYVNLVVTNSGGHLGYVSTRKKVENGRWMDWQLLDWIKGSRQTSTQVKNNS